jgi:asparagine synthase (glutamine-hydrolysing)
MCGIAGFLDWNAGVPDQRLHATARRMGEALEHRGPDDWGTWCDESVAVALAHRRLSILDLSSAGHQPMVSADGRFVISYNGEIYNHLAVRDSLEQAGAAPAWRGHSDTETMLAAFVAWGVEASLPRLVGMFAFAVWDRRERSLYLVRDRIGEKPLYYGWLHSTFAFASELKALRKHPLWNGRIDRDSLSLFMRHNYIPAPYSIYSGIGKLLPGCFLRLEWRGREPLVRPYWSARAAVEAGIEAPFAGDAKAAAAQLDSALREAIAGQMIADVPLGAFLSGGVDSSTVVALMQAQSSRPVRTFSIGFNEPTFNEAEHAKAVARHLGTDHTELYVTPRQALDSIPLLPALYDEPFADSSQLPTFLVARLARQHVTVALSGDGGDELFAGYNRYLFGQALWRRQRRLPSPLRRAISSAITAVPRARWNNVLQLPLRAMPARMQISNPGDKLHKLADIISLADREQVYKRLVSHWDPPNALVLGAREPPTALTDPARRCELDDFVQLMMSLDLVSYLPDDILVKVDRAAMGVSLETRIPMLDHRVVEFAWSLPQEFKLREGQTKWILRQVLYRYVPRELIERPKMGFGIPLDSWLRGPLRSWAESLLEEARLRREGFFDPVLVRTKWQEHLNGGHDWQYLLWDVLVFQAWLEASAVAAADLVA